MNSEPSIIIRLEGNGRIHRPGDALSGEYAFEDFSAEQIKALEVSVLWYTEGKGEEDMAVHKFWRTDVENGDFIDMHRPTRFETTLPKSPLSYNGQIVKIRWCVRVRAFLQRGKEIVGQKDFRLGDIPPVKSNNEISTNITPRRHGDRGENLDGNE
jgi:hypothetical protein